MKIPKYLFPFINLNCVIRENLQKSDQIIKVMCPKVWHWYTYFLFKFILIGEYSLGIMYGMFAFVPTNYLFLIE